LVPQPAGNLHFSPGSLLYIAGKFLFSSQRLVALLGFAYRHISVKFTPKTRKPSRPKSLAASAKTISDWISVKRHEKRMARYHIAVKMGIATSVVGAWETGTARPNTRQMRTLVGIMGKYCRRMNAQATAPAP